MRRDKDLKDLILLAVVLLISVAFTGYAAQTVKNINFLSTPAGTASYIVAVAQGQMLSKMTGLQAIVQPVPGGKAIPSLLESGDGQVAILNSTAAYSAYTGTGEYNKPFRSIRVLQSGNNLYFGLITRRETGIRTIPDLKGKRVAYSFTSYGTKELIEVVLQAYGLNPSKDITLLKAEDPQTALQDMVQGRADALSGSLGGSKMVEAATKTKLVFLPIDADKVASSLQKRMPSMNPVITPSNLSGVDPGVPAVATPTLLIGRADLNEALVYQIVKTMMENYQKLKAINPVLADWNPEAAVRELPVPYHPGAIKYYKEKGLWNSKMDQLQQKLLAN